MNTATATPARSSELGTAPTLPNSYLFDQPIHLIALSGPAGAGKDTVADILVTHCGFTKVAFADALRDELDHAFALRPDERALFTRRDLKELPTQRLAHSESRSMGYIGAVAVATHASVDVSWINEPRSPRQVMQWYGTEYRRNQSPSYWTAKLATRIKTLTMQGVQRIVITDVRFQNEAAMARRLGGLVWSIARPVCSTAATAPHAELAAALSPTSASADSRADFAAFPALQAALGEDFAQHISEQGIKTIRPDEYLLNDSDIHGLREQVLGMWWACEAGLECVTVRIPRNPPTPAARA